MTYEKDIPDYAMLPAKEMRRDADNSCDQGSRLRTDAGDEYNRKTKDDDYR